MDIVDLEWADTNALVSLDHSRQKSSEMIEINFMEKIKALTVLGSNGLSVEQRDVDNQQSQGPRAWCEINSDIR